jgi:hypothetical protein
MSPKSIVVLSLVIFFSIFLSMDGAMLFLSKWRYPWWGEQQADSVLESLTIKAEQVLDVQQGRCPPDILGIGGNHALQCQPVKIWVQALDKMDHVVAEANVSVKISCPATYFTKYCSSLKFDAIHRSHTCQVLLPRKHKCVVEAAAFEYGQRIYGREMIYLE